MTQPTEIVPLLSVRSVPARAVIAAAGEHPREKFFEFFAAQIRNRNTRSAYLQAAHQFLPRARNAAWNCVPSGPCM
jgi:hypothetical protein